MASKDRFKQCLGMHRDFAFKRSSSLLAHGHGERLEAGSAVDDELAKMKGKKDAVSVKFLLGLIE